MTIFYISPTDYTLCEALLPFELVNFELQALTASADEFPFTNEVNATIDNAPQTLIIMTVCLVVLMSLRPTFADRRLNFSIASVWLVLSTASVFLVSVPWTLPKLADAFWLNDRVDLIDPVMHSIIETTNVIAVTANIEVINEWADKAYKPYIHHIARLTLLHTEAREFDIAESLVSTDLDKGDLLPYEEHVHLARAQFLFNQGDYVSSLNQAQIAERLTSSALARSYRNTILGQFAIHLASIGESQAAIARTRGIDLEWDLESQKIVINAVQNGLMIEAFDSNAHEQYLEIYTQSLSLLERRHKIAQSTGVRLPCNMSLLSSAIAGGFIRHSKAHDAINALDNGIKFVENDPGIQALRPIALHQRGMLRLKAGEPVEASRDLEAAFALTPSNDIACASATAFRGSAMINLETYEFKTAYANLALAKSRCPNAEVDRNHFLNIRFSQALASMATSNFENAKRLLQELSLEPEVQQQAIEQLNDLPNAQVRHANLINANQILGRNITGQHCVTFKANSENNNESECSTAVIFDGVDIIGQSNDPISGTYFGADDGESWAIYDSGTGQINTLETKQASSELFKRWTDTNGDYRFDYVDNLDETGFIKSRQTLSGRVAVRLKGGAVSGDHDLWSAPDVFLQGFFNDEFIGQTRESSNSTNPSWASYFVIDYKHGDTFMLNAWDRDIIWHDFIGRIIWNEMPTSGKRRSTYNEFAVAVEVTPTSEPVGVSDDLLIPQNVFSITDFSDDRTPLGDIVRAAQAEQIRADRMAAFGSIVLPEAAVMSLMRRATFATQILTALAGSEILSEFLKTPHN
jgi:tetratricopeptide (TPR) repeat protein